MPKMIKDWDEFRRQALEMAKEGRILIYGEFCPELEEIVLDSIQVARSKGFKEAYLIINSGGGRVLVCTAIKSAMALSGMKFTGVVVGRAYSSAFLLLQACTKRIATPGSYIMFHWGNDGFNNAEIAAILEGKSWPIDSLRQFELEMLTVVSRRTGVSEIDLKEFALYERHFSVSDALNIGFLDEILPELPKEFVLPTLL